MSKRDEHKPAHSPGAQGHDDTMRRQIEKLQSEHSSMMGNQHNPDHDEMVQQRDLTERLYQEQSPKDYQSRDITNHKQGKNKGVASNVPRRSRKGDNGGREDY